MQQARDYEKEADKLIKGDPFLSITKLYEAKNIYAVIMEQNDSRFRREAAYRKFAAVQSKSLNLTMKHSKQEGIQSSTDISWLDNCRIKPLFGFEEVFGLDALKNKFMAHYHRGNANIKLKRKPNILLYGDPGCGKTHIIRALSKEIEPVAVYNLKMGDLLSKYYGETAKIICSMFSELRKKQAVIFIDEIDGIGGIRNNNSTVQIQTLNTMLAELDGIDSSEWPMVIGATNRMDCIDTALLDRFENKTYVPKPSYHARICILKNEIEKNIDGKTDVNHEKIINMVGDGYSGRKIRNLVVKAYEMAYIENKDVVEDDDFEKAYEEIKKEGDGFLGG